MTAHVLYFESINLNQSQTEDTMNLGTRFNKLSLAIIFALNFAVTTDSMAQGRPRHVQGKFTDRNYDGVVGRDRLNQNGQLKTLCKDKFIDQIDQAQRSIDRKELESCENGWREGAKMAERVGQHQGTTLGRIHGLSKGMDVGFEATSGDSSEIQSGRQSITQLDFLSARNRATDLATPVATQDASNDVYKRFVTAVNNQSQPDRQIYGHDVSDFKGLTDGYSYDGQPKINEEAFFKQEFLKHGGQYQFSNEDFEDSREASELNQMDYWQVRNFRGSPKDIDSRFSSWRNSNRAFSLFRSSSLGYLFNSIGSGSRTEMREQLVPTTPTPAPAASAPPKPPLPPRKEIVKVVVQVPDSYYQKIFEESFTRAYSIAIERAFAGNYYAALDESFPKGAEIGEAVGYRVAN